MDDKIDNYNIFDLIGLSDLDADRKNSFLLDLNKILWSEFLFLRLDKILTKEQLIEVEQMVKSETETSEILEYINQKAPNFYGLFLEYSRNLKKEFIRHQIEGISKDLTGMIFDGDDGKEKIQAKLDKYKQAKKFLDEEQWEDLKNLWQN